MESKSKGFLPDWIQSGFISIITPLINLFIKMNINPNFFTVLGLIITTAGTVVIFIERDLIKLAGALILLGGICDIIDGKLARSSNRVTKFGALFDSSIDRYSEVVMFFGIAAYYVKANFYILSVITFIALGGSMMVSYVRARAEGLGLDAKVGIMQRPERVVFIGLGALFSFPLFHLPWIHGPDFPVTLLDIAIWIVAIFANFTAIQRIVHVYRLDNAKTVEERNE